ncbi:Pycsar system effector family protein [Priestia sp. FSL W8-0524]|uniref:Pycsar system effector family protein n=1 Tax=Priestia sp. FSL W8-0524 TaxID=2954625 RepID=UPI0030F5743C
MDRTTAAFENLRNIQDLIKFMDQKAGALFVVYGFIITIFVEFSKRLKFVNLLELDSFGEIILSSITFLIGTVLIFYMAYQLYLIVVFILKPRKSMHYNPQHLSVMYYGHISEMGKSNFVQKFEDMEDKELTKEVLEQVFEVSKIMEQKSNYLEKTMRCLPYTIIGLLIFILFSEIV